MGEECLECGEDCEEHARMEWNGVHLVAQLDYATTIDLLGF